jgi:hypothetical protein
MVLDQVEADRVALEAANAGEETFQEALAEHSRPEAVVAIEMALELHRCLSEISLSRLKKETSNNCSMTKDCTPQASE